MSVNHDPKVVEKEVVFSEGLPVTPFKLFEVTGDVLAFVVSIIKEPFNANAVCAINQLDGTNFWTIETSKAESGARKYKVVSSDLYMSVIVASSGVGQPVSVITTGTVKFYCVFGSLSDQSKVEPAD